MTTISRRGKHGTLAPVDRLTESTPPRIAPLAPVSDLMTVKEAAKYLRVSPGFLYDHAGRNARCDPRIPSVTLGARILFRRSSLDRYIAQLEEASTKQRTA